MNEDILRICQCARCTRLKTLSLSDPSDPTCNVAAIRALTVDSTRTYTKQLPITRISWSSFYTCPNCDQHSILFSKADKTTEGKPEAKRAATEGLR